MLWCLSCDYKDDLGRLVEHIKKVDEIIRNNEDVSEVDRPKINLEAKILNESVDNVTDNLHEDLQIVFIRSLVHLGIKEPALMILDALQCLDANDDSEVLLDVVEGYRSCNEYQKALKVCDRLLSSQEIEDKSIIKFKMGILWSKMGDEGKNFLLIIFFFYKIFNIKIINNFYIKYFLYNQLKLYISSISLSLFYISILIFL